MSKETSKSSTAAMRDAIEARVLETRGDSKQEQEKVKSWLSDHLIIIGPGEAE